MNRDAEVVHQFELSGGALCLDFVNTVGDRPTFSNEHLHRYSDLLAWAEQAGVVTGPTSESLEAGSGDAPDERRRVFRRALRLRETLYRLFSALAADQTPRAGDLDALNRELGRALSHLRVGDAGAGAGEFGWRWDGGPDRLERVVWPVARSAAELLTSGEAAQIKECASETCSWLFVDRSRTHRRRWCDMKSCGNRAKARRHYRRKKAASQ